MFAQRYTNYINDTSITSDTFKFFQSFMPQIISIANQKGGVGKSTITILLATAIAKQTKKKVLILDTDVQGSITNWLESEKNIYEDQAPLVEVEYIEAARVERFLKRNAADYDLIFIDIPRMTSFQKDSAILMLLYMCDSVFIPVIGSQIDVLSTSTFISYMQEVKEYRKEMDYDFTFYGFVNKDNRRKDNEMAKDMVQQMGLPVLENNLKDLKLFTSPSLFESILDSTEGRRRFEPFFKEICKLLKIK